MQPAAEQQIELEDVVSSSSDKAPLTKEASAEKSRATVPSAGKRRHFMRAVIGFVALVAVIGIVSVDRGGCHGRGRWHRKSQNTNNYVAHIWNFASYDRVCDWTTTTTIYLPTDLLVFN